MRHSWIFVLALIAGCSVTAPIEGTLSTGEPITGLATGNMSGEGTVQVSGGGISCSGTYNPLSQARELSVPLKCDGGQTGLAQVTRELSLTSGSGTFELSDGQSGTFTFE